MSDQERLARYVEIWKQACADFVALTRTLTPEEEHVATDLEGWDVHDNVAHTAHLEAVLAGAPEETIEVAPAPHIKGITSYYTEQGVLARRDRTLAELADEIEDAVERRHATLLADPPTDGSVAAPKTPGGVPWTLDTLLGNRPVDVWMHEQDIRRAIGRPGGYDSPAAAFTLGRFASGFPVVLGKKVAPPAGTTVVVDVPEADVRAAAVIGDDGRAAKTSGDDADATITLTPEAYAILAGGRRPADTVDAQIAGDEALARQVLAALAVTP
ncbi:MAG TPA: maleylpyruvate isomerase family mycothiol-dependent enzyme [Marmoricola sp.]